MKSTNTNLSTNAKIIGFNIIIKRGNKKLIEKIYSDYKEDNRIKIFNLFESLKLNDIVIIDKLKYMYIQDRIIEHKQIKIVVK